MSEREVVVACPCPGTPHEEDTVTLFENLPTDAGIACYMTMPMTPGLTVPEITGKWAGILTRLGVEAWSFVDDKGRPLPVTLANNDHLPFGVRAAIANAATERWQEELIRPLPTRTGNSSRTGPTARLTSANRRSGAPRPSRSKPSLLNGSAGKPSAVQAS